MKRRLTFVSNSSSSSFVALVSKDDFDEVFKDFSELEKQLTKEAFLEEETKFLNTEVFVLQGYLEDGECSDIESVAENLLSQFEDYNEEDSYDFNQNFFSKVEDVLSENDKSFCHGDYR